MLVRTRSAAPRVLLLWPGTNGAAAGNFGVPQLVGLATYARAKTGAIVDVRDLAAEVAFGPVSLPALLAGPDGAGYDVIGLSCYASYDWLKVQAMAKIARALWPNALICSGGYHASARPAEFVTPGSPFDVVVVGEGEKPLVRIIESVAGGAPMRGGVILGPSPIEDLDELPPTDWSHLDRYRGTARRHASQAQIYLSRGCPFDCAFCMERAKREVSWRAFSVDRAVDELERLDRFLDLESWTLYVADALFGMRASWRKQLLERLARRPALARQIWLLIRVDMVDDEDLRLFRDARCGLGFGLESGDPKMLATARKAGRLETYLDRMRHVAAKARELDVPWGANVIVGHPGETEESMRTSAAFMREIFLDPRGTTGFLSIDPYRFYPGSPIDAERPAYEAATGARFHRPAWWHDGDPEFLSEWIDPSRDLDYRRRGALERELFGPIVREIPHHFVHRGPAVDYFERAIVDQIALQGPDRHLHDADRYYAWMAYLGQRKRAEAERDADVELAAVCREVRARALPRACGGGDMQGALDAVPRERFVPLTEIAASVRDEAIPLDASGLATVSAMHAYAMSYALAGIAPGARVLDLGAGTGYGAALLGRLVGPSGRVCAVEIDPKLADRAAALLASTPYAEVVAGDGLAPVDGVAAFDSVVFGFAIDALPAWLDGLREGAVVVAPVARAEAQRLTRFVREARGWSHTLHDEVVYVPARTFAPVDPPHPRSAPMDHPARRSAPGDAGSASPSPAPRARRGLPLAR